MELLGERVLARDAGVDEEGAVEDEGVRHRLEEAHVLAEDLVGRDDASEVIASAGRTGARTRPLSST